jgi:hypothetical protein
MVYTDPFYGITDAINAQTRVLKDALTQQQMSVLPASCVQRLRADIEANDTYIRDTEKMIADINAKNAGKALDAEEMASNASTLNHLYTLISVQKQRYTNEIIRICSQERTQQPQVPQVQQIAPVTGTRCNGKSWGTCPTGTTFSCPASGDPQCISNLPTGGNTAADKFTALLNASKKAAASRPPALTGGHGGSGAAIVYSSVSDGTVAKTTNDPESDIKASSTEDRSVNAHLLQPGQKIRVRLWSWFRGLFGY